VVTSILLASTLTSVVQPRPDCGRLPQREQPFAPRQRRTIVITGRAVLAAAGFSLTGSGGGDYEPKPNPSTTVHGTYYDTFALPVP
jgi:hypothetical protein